ncbi:MAG: TlyA family rRNA (cytidine-2'-O)-methyltransferase [Dehalococcoidia bacterium]|nr:TlyA family rRNA (cytidine-2'-O)-methyltransferase [Dehalococcoidia bacterium]
MPPRERLDRLLVSRSLVPSREQAQRLIYAGDVRVDGAVGRAPAQLVSPTADLHIRRPPPFVSRGGDKLAHALEVFTVDVAGSVCLDVGASTGGFTDVLLQRSAVRVYAVDVGRAQLAWKLRQDQRVVVMEGVNARYLKPLPEPVDLITVDVAFISLAKVLPAVLQSLQPHGLLLALIKPQFEAGPDRIGRGGVVRDPEVHRMVLNDVLATLPRLNLTPVGLTPSPLRGPAGNVEFFVLAQGETPAEPRPDLEAADAIARALAAAEHVPARKRGSARSRNR